MKFLIAKSITTSSSKYHYEPYLTFSGSNFLDVPITQLITISQFSVVTWFKTSTDYTSNAFIVNKGGFGSETAGRI